MRYDRFVWLYRLVRLTLAILFIWAGTIKIADLDAFAVIIRDFGLVPGWSVVPIAVVLPVVEVIAAIGLIFDFRGSLSVITGLLLLFMAILIYGIALGLDIDCGCFGPNDPEFRAYHGLRIALYRDLVMVTGIVFLYWWRFRNSTGFAVLLGENTRGKHLKRG